MARRKARLFLERAFLPPEYVLPPQASARVLEEALHQHYSEEDLMSGKRYLRRLRALMEILEPGGAFYQPAVRQIIGQGKSLPPATLDYNTHYTIFQEVLTGEWVASATLVSQSCEASNTKKGKLVSSKHQLSSRLLALRLGVPTFDQLGILTG